MLITQNSSSFSLQASRRPQAGPQSEPSSSLCHDSVTLGSSHERDYKLTTFGQVGMVAAQAATIFAVGGALSPYLRNLGGPVEVAVGALGMVLGATALGVCAAAGATHLMEQGARKAGEATLWAKPA